MKSTYFYFTPEDWRLIVESELLKEYYYYLTGVFSSKTVTKYSLLSEIPSLGISQHGENVQEDSYLIMKKSDELKIREIKLRTGQIHYAIDQLVNPNSVILRPCGLFNGNVMIFGEIGTVHKTKISNEICNSISILIKKYSIKIQTFYLGQNAMELFTKGIRFTGNVKSQENYNLRKA
jgi:hypothetical protein